jgi:hypothetical protein
MEGHDVLTETNMSRTLIALMSCTLLAGAGMASSPARAVENGGARQPEFLGIDLDNGGIFYNGQNTGRYCVYRTVDVFNRYTGYVEARRVRRCGRGLYLP